jgi:6-phosphogluconolactonase
MQADIEEKSMIRGMRAALLLAAVVYLAGCKGFWDAPGSSSSGGCTTNCTTATSGGFYILNSGTTPQIVGQAIVSGKIASISGSPWGLSATPFAMAMSPNGSFLYVSTSLGVFVYPVNNGTLGTAATISQDSTALALRVDPSGNWLIEALQTTGSATIAAIPISSTTGLATGAELTANYNLSNASVQNGEIAISPDDTNVFVALGAGGVIVVPFNASAAAGVVPFSNSAKVIPVTNSGASSLSVAVDPGNHLFYVGQTLANSSANSGGLFVYNYSSLTASALTQATGSPIASGGLAPNAILPLPGGSYVYVANGHGTGTTGTIDSFSISSNGSAYTIAAGSSVAAGLQPVGLVEDSTDTFLLAVNSLGGPYFSSYTFDATTAGKLDAQVVANTGTTPLAIVAGN